MIEVENVKVLLLEDTDFQPCENDNGTAQLTPEADKKAILAEIVIFGDRLIKNRHARECVAELTQRGEMEHCRLMKYCNIPLSETPNAMRLLQKLMDAGYSAQEIAQAALAEEARRAENKQVRVWHYEICNVSGNWHEDETPHKPDEEMFVVRNVRPVFFGEYTESENRTTWLNVKAFFALLDSRHIDYAVRENGAVVVHGYLDLEGTGITTLPDNLSVGGDLDLRDTGITTLPDNLSVGGNLYLRGTRITTLPDNLSVGGILNLRGAGITALPDNLSVGGSLGLEGTGITTLPDNLSVGGSLYLRGAGITALPDNLSVGGSLYLRGAGITALPDNLSVGGSLGLEGTGITTLPDNLSVGGHLDLRGTRITVIPGSIRVGGKIVTGAFRAGTEGGAA